MSLLLPAAPAVGAYSDIIINGRHLLRFDTMADVFDDGTILEIQCSLIAVSPSGLSHAYLVSGLGSTPADAFLAMFADEEFEGLRVPAEVAIALDELGHQAVRIVCQRLSGGQMESAMFADSEPMEKHK